MYSALIGKTEHLVELIFPNVMFYLKSLFIHGYNSIYSLVKLYHLKLSRKHILIERYVNAWFAVLKIP